MLLEEIGLLGRRIRRRRGFSIAAGEVACRGGARAAWRNAKVPAEADRMAAVCLRLARGGGGGPTGAESDFLQQSSSPQQKPGAATRCRSVEKGEGCQRREEWAQEEPGKGSRQARSGVAKPRWQRGAELR